MEAVEFLNEAVRKFAQLDATAKRHNAEAKSASAFLDAPTIQHGQAQVPIIGTRAGVDSANAMIERHAAECDAVACLGVWSVFFAAKSAERRAKEKEPK